MSTVVASGGLHCIHTQTPPASPPHSRGRYMNPTREGALVLTMVVSGRAQAREACSCTASTRMQRRSLERLFIVLASWKAVKVWVKGENKKGTQRRSMEELLVMFASCPADKVRRQ